MGGFMTGSLRSQTSAAVIMWMTTTEADASMERAKAMAETLTHFDERGAARMVDVGSKPVTRREAVAVGRITMAPETLRVILDGTSSKGDVLGVARLAGIM